MKVAVRGVDLFFDVDGVKVTPDGPWMRDRPTVILLHTVSGADHSLVQGAHRACAHRRRSGRLSRPPRGRPERLELARALDDRHLGRRPRSLLRRAGDRAAGAARNVHRRRDRARPRRAASRPGRAARPREHRRALRAHALDRRVRPDRRAGGRRSRRALLRRPHRGALRRVPARVRAALHAQPDLPGHDCADGDEHGADRSLGPDRCPELRLAGGGGANPVSHARPGGRRRSVDDDQRRRRAGQALPTGLVRYEHFADTGHGVFRDRPEAIELVREFLSVPPEPA